MSAKDIVDNIYITYKDALDKKMSEVDITQANLDLQDTIKQEILFKINEILDDYNIEPRRSSK